MVQAIYEHVAAHKVQMPPEVDPRFDAPPAPAAEARFEDD
jgi:hypothetical protein